MAPTKRTAIPLSKKQEALKLLGVRPDGTISHPQRNEDTNKPHTPSTVASKLNIPRPAIYQWMRKRRRIVAVPVVQAKRINNIRDGSFHTLEAALYAHLVRTIRVLNGVSPFREAEIREIALRIRDRLLPEVQTRLESAADSSKGLLAEELRKLRAFKASTGWFYKFCKRHQLGSFKPRGESAFLNMPEVASQAAKLKRLLAFWDIRDIANTDEVGVLYRSLPSRSINPRDMPTGHKRVKDRLTAVLTVYADGTKGPLVVIGPSARPVSFPRRFDPQRDLGIYYYSQKNSWNTKALWSSQMERFNLAATQQFRKVLHLVDNCSAHCIGYDSLKQIENHFLPPNTTSALQPVDAAMGRSFKAAFRRLLVNHILEYVDRLLASSAEPVFKLHQAVTIYDGVRLMAAAWDAVPKSVVLNGWLKVGILAPHQALELRDELSRCRGVREKAQRPLRGTLFDTDRVSAELRAAEAQRRGEEYIKELDGETSTAPFEGDGEEELSLEVTGDQWLQHTEQDVREQLTDLQEIGIIDDLDVHELDAFLHSETDAPICLTASENDVLEESVLCAVEGLEDRMMAPGALAVGSEGTDASQATTEPLPLETVSEEPLFAVRRRFIEAGKQLNEAANTLRARNDDCLCNEASSLMLAELNSKVSDMQIAMRKARKQAKITAFFTSK